MNLTQSQKKFIKKNLKHFSIDEIAIKLSIPQKDVLNFLQTHWRKEKYQKFLIQHKKQTEPKRFPLNSLSSFNFKEWLQQNWIALLFLGLLAFAVYFNALGNDFVSDDISGIKENPDLGNFSLLLSKPLTFFRYLFYFTVYKIWGMEPLFFRLINVFFHLDSVLLTYFLVSLMANPILAFFAAGIFAVHPIHVEAVTWISGGPYAQSTFFLLVSFLLYLLSKAKNSKKLYLFSLFTFLLSAFSTEKALIFPLMLFIFELSSDSVRKNWRKLAPFFVMGGLWFLFFFLQGALTGRVSTLQTDYYQGPGLENPLIQIPVALSSYLQLIFWPDKLTLYHSEMMFTQINYLIRVTVTLGLLAAIIFFFKKDKKIFFWLSFFIISLLPTLTPLKISWIVAERYVYLGTLGIFMIIALGLQKIGQITNKTTLYILFGIILSLLSLRTINRNADWKNQDTLWLATARTSPSSAQNHNNLGDYYARQDNLQKAVEEFKIAIQLQPNYGDAFHNLANTYQQMGQMDLAIENYQKAILSSPHLWQSYQNLAAIYFGQGKFNLAEENIKMAIQIIPQNPNLYLNLGVIYLQEKDKTKAKEAFQQALQLDPQNENAKMGLEETMK